MAETVDVGIHLGGTNAVTAYWRAQEGMGEIALTLSPERYTPCCVALNSASSGALKRTSSVTNRVVIGDIAFSRPSGARHHVARQLFIAASARSSTEAEKPDLIEAVKDVSYLLSGVLRDVTRISQKDIGHVTITVPTYSSAAFLDGLWSAASSLCRGEDPSYQRIFGGVSFVPQLLTLLLGNWSFLAPHSHCESHEAAVDRFLICRIGGCSFDASVVVVGRSKAPNGAKWIDHPRMIPTTTCASAFDKSDFSFHVESVCGEWNSGASKCDRTILERLLSDAAKRGAEWTTAVTESKQRRWLQSIREAKHLVCNDAFAGKGNTTGSVQLGEDAPFQLSSDLLSLCCADFVNQIVRACRQAIEDAERLSGEGRRLDAILLVGGSTKTPGLVSAIRNEFKHVPIAVSTSHEPTAIATALISRAHHQRESERVQRTRPLQNAPSNHSREYTVLVQVQPSGSWAPLIPCFTVGALPSIHRGPRREIVASDASSPHRHEEGDGLCYMQLIMILARGDLQSIACELGEMRIPIVSESNRALPIGVVGSITFEEDTTTTDDHPARVMAHLSVCADGTGCKWNASVSGLLEENHLVP